MIRSQSILFLTYKERVYRMIPTARRIERVFQTTCNYETTDTMRISYLISQINLCPLVNQQPSDLEVSSKGCGMQGGADVLQAYGK